MSSFNEEIFNYLTRKENFFSAYEINQLFPEVKNTLVEQFWMEVKESLIEISKSTNWKIEISDNIFDPYSSLNMVLDDNFCVSFEKLHGQTYYGLWIDFDNKELDLPKIREYVANMDTINWMKKNNYWLGWTMSGANFDNIETLKKILPDNRRDFAQELASILFIFGEELRKDIEIMSKMMIK